MAHVPCSGSGEELSILNFSSDVFFSQVFPKEFYRSGDETVEFNAISGIPRNCLEKILRTVNSEFPLAPLWDHLKRINREGLILWSPEDRNVAIPDDVRVVAPDAALVSVSVPRFPVFTKSQFEMANKVWPIRVTTPLVDICEQLPDEESMQTHINQLTQLLDQNNASNDSTPSVLCSLVSPDKSIRVFGSHAHAASPLHFRHAVLDACAKLGSLSEYLATGYTTYLLGEPCVMCAMALLHSRVAEVVFASNGRKQNFGGLGSSVSVHCNKQLNHRFKVWTVAETKRA